MLTCEGKLNTNDREIITYLDTRAGGMYHDRDLRNPNVSIARTRKSSDESGLAMRCFLIVLHTTCNI